MTTKTTLENASLTVDGSLHSSRRQFIGRAGSLAAGLRSTGPAGETEAVRPAKTESTPPT